MIGDLIQVHGTTPSCGRIGLLGSWYGMIIEVV